MYSPVRKMTLREKLEEKMGGFDLSPIDGIPLVLVVGLASALVYGGYKLLTNPDYRSYRIEGTITRVSDNQREYGVNVTEDHYKTNFHGTRTYNRKEPLPLTIKLTQNPRPEIGMGDTIEVKLYGGQPCPQKQGENCIQVAPPTITKLSQN